MQTLGPTLVTVNGKSHAVGFRLTFEAVAELAAVPVDTVTFSRGRLRTPSGILCPGESVRTKPGMIFTATTTSNA